MTIILDFDDTLFDTARFKKTLVAIFKKHKVDFWKTYEQVKKPKGVYSLKKHLALIQKIDIKRIEEDINRVNFKKFLFPYVLKFLKTFKKNNSLILLSWGEKKFQERKIYSIGQEFISLFDEIITGPVEKVKVVDKILKSYKSRPVVFVDDKTQELEKIRKSFQDIILIKEVWQLSKIN